MVVKTSTLTFLLLNLQRLLSIIVLLMTFSALITMMVLDARDVSEVEKEYSAEELDECEVYPGTDIPTSVGGMFWSQLNRVALILLTILCLLSEISWGGIIDRFFSYCLPILGPSFGTGSLGLLQILISTTMLSHYLDRFPEVSSWLLFFVGFFNLLLGGIFGSRGKEIRSISSKRRERFRRNEMKKLDIQRRTWNSDLDLEKKEDQIRAGRNGHNRENSKHLKSLQGRKERARGTWEGLRAVGKIPLTSNSVIQHQRTAQFNKTSAQTISKPLHASPLRRIRDLSEAFPSLETESQRELLRQKAREANARMELEQERLLQQAMSQNFPTNSSEREGQRKKRSSRSLSKDFAWDSERQLIREKNREEKERKRMIKRAQEGASSDLSRPKSSSSSSCGNWRRSFISSSSSLNIRRSMISFKRKSLVLSKSASPSAFKKGKLTDSTRVEMTQKKGSQPLTFDQQVSMPSPARSGSEAPPVPPLPPAFAYFPDKSKSQENREIDEEMLETTNYEAEGKTKPENYGYQFDWENPPKRRLEHFRTGSDASALKTSESAPGEPF